MTLLTPTFTEQRRANGSAGTPVMHVLSAHEPTREGEQPLPSPAAPPATTAAPQHQPLKIALIGTAPSSRMLAPFNDPSWTIWVCSPGNMNALPRADAWFEIHSNLLWPEYESYGKPYVEWLKTLTIPVYMQDQSLVPTARTYPKDEMVAEFGDEFFSSSFAWMMALAIKMGAVEIALYGIDMASRDEYIRQRPGFYHFKREAMKRGIKVSAPHESDIMQSPGLYGYSDSTAFGRKVLARRAEVNGRIQGMVGQRDGLNQNITYLQGALEDIDYFESIWSGVTNDTSRLQSELAAARAEITRMRMPASPPLPADFKFTETIAVNTAPKLRKKRRKR